MLGIYYSISLGNYTTVGNTGLHKLSHWSTFFGTVPCLVLDYKNKGDFQTMGVIKMGVV